MKCYNCEADVISGSVSCPSCGAVFNEEKVFDEYNGRHLLKVHQMRANYLFFKVVFWIFALGLGFLFGTYIYDLYINGGFSAINDWLFNDQGLKGLLILLPLIVLLYFLGTEKRQKALLIFYIVMQILGLIAIFI